jgi:hypothetical protein
MLTIAKFEDSEDFYILTHFQVQKAGHQIITCSGHQIIPLYALYMLYMTPKSTHFETNVTNHLVNEKTM